MEKGHKDKAKGTRRFWKTKAPKDWEIAKKDRNEVTRQRKTAIKDYWREQSVVENQTRKLF